MIRIMETKTRYSMVGKNGREIFHADSFMGFISGVLMIQLLMIVVITAIGAVVLWYCFPVWIIKWNRIWKGFY